MELREMCRIMHPYTCPVCGNDMLFFTRAKNNMVIDYKNIFQTKDKETMLNYLADKNVEYLKCMVCGKIYIIDWTHNYARPLLYKDALKQFGCKFKE